MPQNDLTAWLENLRDSNHEVRVSTKSGGKWIDRRELIGEEGEEIIYTLDAEPKEETRFYLKKGNDKPNKWNRYTFSVLKRNGEKLETGNFEEIQIVLELPSPDDESPYGLKPWKNNDTVVFSSEVLQHVNTKAGFEPVRANRVAGLEKEKERLKRFIDTADKDWGLSEETGIILEGPPGTGKTELVMEYCQEKYGSMPVMISGPEILSKYVGESERMLREKFREARDSEHRILYIDELDAIARARSEVSQDYSAQIVAQLLVLLDGVNAKEVREREEGRPLKVIASTNLSHVVDPALRRPGRLGSRPIQFERPDEAERRSILHHYLEKIHSNQKERLGSELRDFVTDGKLNGLKEIVDETEGFTGADLEDLIHEAVSEARESEEDKLTLELLDKVLEQDFNPPYDFKSEEITESDLEATAPLKVDPRIMVLKKSDEGLKNSEEIAKDYFKKLQTSEVTGEDIKFKYREVGSKDILDNDSLRAKENLIRAFQHSENERLCLYIKDAKKLVKAKEHSSLVDRLIGMINEQLLQWEKENVLILDPVPGNVERKITGISLKELKY